MLSRYEFEVLSWLERNGPGKYPIRSVSDEVCISGNTVMHCLDTLRERGLLRTEGDFIELTEKALDTLEPFRVKRAVILAAGIGNRMLPATQDRPKPMVRVNGVRIIDTLLDALVRVGIRDITVVGGYKYDRLQELRMRYPFLQLIENPEYAVTNNISSAMLLLDKLQGGCYFCEADLYISAPDEVIKKYQYASNILGSFSMETDDWSFRMTDGYLSDYGKGNTWCYNYYGIAYFTAEDCEKLRHDFRDVYEGPDGRDYFWEFIPFVLRKENYKIEIRPCRKQAIMEIDNYYELAQLDHSYPEI